MCDTEMDYTLVIDYERQRVDVLIDILEVLYLGASSACYGDIDALAEEVISRMMECGYRLKETRYRKLAELIRMVFKVLKKIHHEVTEQMVIIHREYNKYYLGVDSPVVSPPVSPEVKVPKIMKKIKKKMKKSEENR
jgi:hypothetical protein